MSVHFIIQKEKFVQSIQLVTKAISFKTTIPILAGIKIEVTEEGITLTGSDSDISIESFIPAEEDGQQNVQILQTGKVVLQAKTFPEIIKKLPEEQVEIIVQDQFLTTVRSGSSVFHLNGLDAEDYPRLPQVEETNVFYLPANLFKNIIRQTVFAVATNETRPVLTGVNFTLEKKQLTCTATDSHRLAMRKAVVETYDEELSFENVVIPGKSLTELNKILEDSDELVYVVVTESQVLFKLKHLLFFTRLLDGTYPMTKNIIPTAAKTDILLETTPFLEALERALLLSREGKNNVVNVKTLDNNELEITSVTPEIGKVTERVQMIECKGEELRISFNGKNVIDALKVIDSEEVNMRFTGAMSPFVIQPTEHDHSVHLFSPVRTF